MRRTVSAGDLALTAQPATSEAFAPFGTLLTSGDRAFLGRRGRVLVALDDRRTGPRRVTHLQRYPEAKRAFLSVSGAAMWVVVLEPGDRPGGRPAAFLVPPGTCAVLNEGVWHAGPVPLEDATICEMLEAIGSADRLDRKSLPDLVDVLGVRVLLSEEPAAASGALDLAAPNAVLLDASLHGHLRLGCLTFDDLEVEEERPALTAELNDAADGLRSMWRHTTDLAEIPGVPAGRELYEELGLDLQRFPPRSEQLLDRVLRGGGLPKEDTLSAALTLCTLRMRVPMAAYDATSLGHQVLIRTGATAEAYAGTGRNRVVVAGRPVLCDQEGPFGSPIGDSHRTRIRGGTRRALVVLYLPTSADPNALEALLDGVAKTIAEHCAGRALGRLVVG